MTDIIHVSPYIEPVGGRSIFVNELAQMQAEDGNKVILIGRVKADSAKTSNGVIICSPGVPKNFRLGNLYLLTYAVRLVNKMKPRVLHIHGPLYINGFGMIPRLLTRISDTRVVYTLHAGVLKKEFLVEVLSLHKFFNAKIVLLNPKLVRELYRSRLYKNEADTVFFVPVFYRRELEHVEVRKQVTKDLNILYLGGYNVKKGILDVLFSFILALRKCRNIRLTIAGKHNDEVYHLVRRIILSHNIVGYVKLLKWLSGHEYLKTLIESNVLIHLSKYEGIPLVIADAMALGNPVITYPVGGIPYVVRDGYNGYVVKDLVDAANKIITLCEALDKFRVMANNALRFARNVLNPYRVLRLYYEVYGS